MNKILFLLLCLCGCFIHSIEYNKTFLTPFIKGLGLFLAFEGIGLFIISHLKGFNKEIFMRK